jgi:methionyl-tRNA synthetase
VRVLFAPFLPFSCADLDGILGATSGWHRSELETGRAIDKPTPLYRKIDLEQGDEG